MPWMQAMVDEANTKFNRSNIGGVNPAPLEAPGATLAAAAGGVGLAVSAQALAYLNTWPMGLQRAIVAAVAGAARQKLPVTFAWAPAAHFQVSFWEVPSTAESTGGMTVFLGSPYPP